MKYKLIGNKQDFIDYGFDYVNITFHHRELYDWLMSYE